ncbi:MAG: hypothetical protein BGN92_02265 [Sphingobacteriales bacterium 41-5]|mgnify:CR=1 FL=1|nr:MAG: hypothetical protein BGN92_02265 [Sphingobacteriales bacterium 41-5]
MENRHTGLKAPAVNRVIVLRQSFSKMAISLKGYRTIIGTFKTPILSWFISAAKNNYLKSNK